MQVVIDITEYDYRQIKEYYEKNDTVEAIYSYIYHGTPLPKGHGKLKDVDKIETLLDLDKADNKIVKALKNIIESVSTIIEADEESEE